MAQINIAGTLHNTEEIQGDALNSHVVAHADEILDSTKEKKQSEVNAEVDQALDTLQTQITEEASNREQSETALETELKEYTDAEQTRAEAAEQTLQNNINSERSRAEAAEQTLQSNINAERLRAETSEQNLQSNINAEQSRAEAAEQSLRETYAGLTQSDIEVVATLPNQGVPNKIYRLVGTTTFSDYQFNASDLSIPVLLATYDVSMLEAQNGYYECQSAGDASDKAITANGFVMPAVGGSLKVKMINKNTANNVRLVINSDTTNAKAIFYNGSAVNATNTWEAGETVIVYFDGIQWQAFNVKGGASDGVFDISQTNASGDNPATYDNLAAALSGANVPENVRNGGMSVKYLENMYADYNVEVTEGLTEQPTGTLLESTPSITSGTYKASQLSAFLPLPDTVGATATYYIAVTVDETTTYTTWAVTKINEDSSVYVQYRLMTEEWSAAVQDWQGVDETPTAGSKNTVTSGGVASALEGKATLGVEYASTIIPLTYESKYVKDDGTQAASGYHATINVSAGEVYYMRYVETQAVYAGTPLLLQNADGTYTPLDYSISSGKRYVRNAEVVVPNGASKLIVNSRYNTDIYKDISKRTKKNIISYANVGNDINNDLFPIKQELSDTDIEIVENSKINGGSVGNEIVIIGSNNYNRLVVNVSEGEQYFISGYTSSPVPNYVITTNGGTVIESDNTGKKDFIVTIPRYGGKLHININKSKYDEFLQPVMKITGYISHEHDWRGYKWAAIGDSLTDSSINAKVKYPRFIKLMTGIQYQELGVGGTGYWRTSSGNDTYGDRAAQVASDTDIITFFGSINDWRASGNDIPNGNPSDTILDNTLSGYMNHAIDVAMETAPNAMIVLVSHMYYKGISETRQEELVATLKGVAEYRQLPFVDMYHSTMFKRILDATWAEVYTTDYSDSAETYGHPSIPAHLRLITPRFVEILSKFMPLHTP